MKQKTKKAKHSHTVRLDDREEKVVADDIANMVAGGATPVSAGAYCKHAVLSHARLRLAETMIRDAATTSRIPEVQAWAEGVITELRSFK